MTAFVDQLVTFVAGHGALAYGVIFLICAAEAVPVIGSILPGSLAIVALSALIPGGALALWPTLIFAIAGAIAGDGISYWLGHHYRHRVLSTWPFRRNPKMTQASEAMFTTHGIKAIFFGRFTPARAFVPVAAGIAGMPVQRFYIANVASALAWAPAHVLPGALLGAAASLLDAVAGRLAVLAVGVLLVCWLALLASRWLTRQLGPGLAGVQARLWGLMQDRSGVLADVARALLDPARRETRLTLPLLLLLPLGLCLGLAVLADDGGRTGANTVVANLVRSLHTSWADDAFSNVVIFLGLTATVAAVAVAIWSLMRRAWWTLGCWLVAVAFALWIAGMTEGAPSDGTAWLGTLGQQAGLLALLLGLLVVLCARELAPRACAVLVASGSLAVTLAALANLYFGVEPLSSILAGLAAAAGGIGIVGLVHLARPARPLGAVSLLVLMTAFVAGGGVVLTAVGPAYVGPARAAPPTQTIPAEAW